MNIEPMETPKTRAEFEHGFHLLENLIRNGKMHFAAGIDVESLAKVRKLPNGRIDFLSVDEMARLQANQTKMMQKIKFQLPNANDEQ